MKSIRTIRVLAMLETDFISGSAKVFLEFARQAMSSKPDLPRIELSVITFSRNEVESEFATAVRNIGVPLDVVHERRRFDTGVIPQLRTIVQKRGAELIWTNSVKSHFLVKWAGLNKSRKWVAFHHGYTTTDLKMRIYNQLDRWSLPAADRMLTVSRAFAKDLERRNIDPDRISVVHNAVGPFMPVTEERKNELRRRLSVDGQTKLLLTVGRLSREKGHANLVNAFSKVYGRTGSLPMHLVIVGEGPERSRIESLSRNLKLSDAVTLVGHQYDVSPYYAIADAFVLPSQTEGSPNALLEAMVSGVPVVATAVGGVPEIVSDRKEALLVEKGDTAALAAAIVEVLENHTIRDRLVSAAYEVVSVKTLEAHFQSLVSVFEAALRNDRP